MKKNALYIGIVVVIAIVLVLVFTNKTTTVDTDNGEINVTQDNETITVNTNAGSLEAGENVSMPDGFPTDVYVADGTLIAALQLDENNGYMLNIEADGTVSEVKAEYTTELENDEWSITSSLDLPTGSSIFAEKDNRLVTVTIASEDGKTMVVVNTSVVEAE